MKILHIATLAAGIAVAGVPAALAQDTMTTTMEEMMMAPGTAATEDQIATATSATIVEYDDAVGLPDDANGGYTKADLQKWLANNTSIASLFDTSEYDVSDVEAASWDGGSLMLYVKTSSVDDSDSDSDDSDSAS